MSEPLVEYPAEFTDRKWKEFEKKLQVSATGIGKALRVMEKTAADLNKAMVRTRMLQAAAKKLGKNYDPKEFAAAEAADKALAVVPGLHAKHLKAILAARTVVGATATKLRTTNKDVANWLHDYEAILERYFKVWKAFDPDDDRGLKFVITDVDTRVRTLKVHDHVFAIR